MQHITIEYFEKHIPQDKPLEVDALSVDRVTILDVTPVGDEYRYRFTIAQESTDD